MLIIRGGINSKKRELCPTALALSAFYYNKNKHADTYIMYLHAYSTRDTRKSAHCLWLVGHTPGESKRGQDTEWDASHGMEEIREFCFKDLPPSVYSETFLPSGIPVILLITPKRSMLRATIFIL